MNSDNGNAPVATSAYEAFAAGDADTLAAIFADCVWHVPGHSQIAGDFKGAGEIMQFVGKLAELAAGEFRADVERVFSDGDRVITLHTTQGQRPDGRTLESLGVLVWRFEDGRAAEIWEMFYDQYAEDAFWS